MRTSSVLGLAARITSVAAAFLSVSAQPVPAAKEAHGLPARPSPTEYIAQGKAGNVTIAADFTGHGIPNEDAPLNAEDYVAVEVGLFGPPGARLTITASEFSLRINGKKEALPSQPWALAVKNIKDPEWLPPETEGESKSKGSISGSGGGGRQPGDPPPLPPKVPVELLRAWQQRVKRAALPEGDRALPQAGLLFFQHRGKTENIRTVELIYEGPAGKATITLQ